MGVGTGQTSNVELFGTVVELIMATIATDRFTRIAYTLAKPKKPIMPSTVRLLIHPVVSSLYKLRKTQISTNDKKIEPS